MPTSPPRACTAGRAATGSCCRSCCSPRRYRLRAINRWKMFDNLRRSLVAPMSLALLLLALAGAVAVAVGGAGAGAGGVLRRAADGRGGRLRAQPRRPRQAPFLPPGRGRPARALCAAGCGSSRSCCSRRCWRSTPSCARCTAWPSAAATCCSGPPPRPRRPQATTGFAAPLRRHRRRARWWRWCCSARCSPPAPRRRALAAALCLLWAASPLWTWWVSRPRPARHDAALPAARPGLPAKASRATPGASSSAASAPTTTTCRPTTCRSCRTTMVAHRTSPTNIGLYLLSAACARAVRLDRHAGAARAAGGHAGHAGHAAAPPRPLPELVRHADAARRCCRCTCPPSTAATCAATCSRWPRPASSWRARRTTPARRSGHQASRRRLEPLLARVPEALPDDAALARLLAMPEPLARADTTPRSSSTCCARPPANSPRAGRARPSCQAPAPTALRDQLAWCLADHLATLRTAALDVQAAAPLQDSHAHEAVRRLRALAARCEQLACGQRLRLPLPPQAAPVPHRLPRRRAAARRQLLRPARVGVAADQPAGHRQGRRAGQPLGRARPAVLRGRRARRVCARGRARCSST